MGDAGQRLAERLAYRPREVVVVALLAAGLFGGLGIERWRARHPAAADRLELEPARPPSPLQVRAAPRPRSRSVPPRCEEPATEPVTASATGPVLDLNRATPAELARVAGISWRLAARIVAARDGVPERGAPQSAPVDGAAIGLEAVGPDAPGARAADPAPDADLP
jgi:hypothetical protein